VIRHLLPIPAVLLAAGVLAVTGAQADSTPAGVAKEAPRVVPAAKLVKAVGQREAWRARAVRAERVLRHEPSVQEALTVASVAYDVPRTELSSVAWCESTNRPDASNGRYRGLFQFGPIFESSPYGRAGLSVWSPLASAMAAAYIVRHGGSGWSPWECSPRGKFAP